MKAGLTLLCFILSHLAVHAETGGVWDQMERGEVNPGKGIVKDVQPSGMDLLVTIETKDELGQPVQSTSKLCRENSTQWPDLVQASMVRAKRDDLEEKKRSAKPIEFGQSGPFNSCFTFVK